MQSLQTQSQTSISSQDQSNLEPAEKVEMCFDVKREGGNVVGGATSSNQLVFGRYIATNYRIRFIENGRRDVKKEDFDANSIPFGNI